MRLECFCCKREKVQRKLSQINMSHFCVSFGIVCVLSLKTFLALSKSKNKNKQHEFGSSDHKIKIEISSREKYAWLWLLSSDFTWYEKYVSQVCTWVSKNRRRWTKFSLIIIQMRSVAVCALPLYILEKLNKAKQNNEGP